PTCAASRGAVVQTGGEDGSGPGVSAGCGAPRGRGSNGQQRQSKPRAGRPTRARRLTGPGFKRAATAEEGPGRAVPPGRGAPRGRGSSRQQRQRKGRGGRLGRAAASRGAGVQAGGDGEGVGRGAVRARAPARGRIRGRGGLRTPPSARMTCTDPERPRGAPPAPRRPPRGTERGGWGGCARSSRPVPVSGPPFSRLPVGRGSPAAARIAATGPGEGRSAPGCAPPRRSGDVAVRRALPHPLTLRVHPGPGVGRPPVGRPAAPGRRRHATPAPLPLPPPPPPPATA